MRVPRQSESGSEPLAGSNSQRSVADGLEGRGQVGGGDSGGHFGEVGVRIGEDL